MDSRESRRPGVGDRRRGARAPQQLERMRRRRQLIGVGDGFTHVGARGDPVGLAGTTNPVAQSARPPRPIRCHVKTTYREPETAAEAYRQNPA